MSIATAITNLQGRVESAYDKIEEKGGALPQVLNTANLPDAIDSIPQGEVDKRKFGATIDDVFQTVTENDRTTLNLFGGCTSLTFTGVTNIPEYGMSHAFYHNRTITDVSFPALTTVDNYGFHNTFAGCTSLFSVSFPELTIINGNDITNSYVFYSAFKDCIKLSSVSFPKLSSIAGRIACSTMFDGCIKLSSVSFPELLSINGYYCLQYAFQNCTSLSSVSFPELSNINGNAAMADTFKGCTNLELLSFPKLKQISGIKALAANWLSTMSLASTTVSFPELSAVRDTGTNGTQGAFGYNSGVTRFDFPKLTIMASKNTDNRDAIYLFNNCLNLTEIHFGAENQSIIEDSSGYATKWGAPNENCQVFFDL